MVFVIVYNESKAYLSANSGSSNTARKSLPKGSVVGK